MTVVGKRELPLVGDCDAALVVAEVRIADQDNISGYHVDLAQQRLLRVVGDTVDREPGWAELDPVKTEGIVVHHFVELIENNGRLIDVFAGYIARVRGRRRGVVRVVA